VFLYAGSNIQNASEQFVWCIHVSFVNFALHPSSGTKTERNYFCRFKQLCHRTNSELDICTYAMYFLTMTDTTTPKNIDLPFWIILCIKVTFVTYRKHAASLLHVLRRKINVIYRYEKLRHVVWVKGRFELSGTINSELFSVNGFAHMVYKAIIFFSGTCEV
jgi:hypothetical protein